MFILISQHTLAVNADISNSHMTVSIHDARQDYDLAKGIRVYKDDLSLDVDAIVNIPDEKWNIPKVRSDHYGQRINNYWLKVSVEGFSKREDEPILRLDYPHLDFIDIFIIHGDAVTHFQGGDLRRFDVRPLNHRIYLFPLAEVDSDEAEIYVNIKTSGPIMVPLDITTYERAINTEQAFFLWNGIYLGIIAIIAFYNIFLWLSLRDVTYLIYLIYAFATGFLQICLCGLGFQYLWPESPGMNNLMIITTMPLMQAAAILFVIRFMNLYQKAHWFDKYGAYTLLTVSLVSAAINPLVEYSAALWIGQLFGMLCIACGIYIGLKMWLKGIKYARLFTMAWLVHLIFIAWYMFDVVGWVPTSLLGSQGIAIGTIFEIVLLSLSFVDRVSEEKELRLEAQREAINIQKHMNEQLDTKVKERTEELEFANRRLRELSITDSLTGLFNRRHFDDMFQNEFIRAQREQTPIAVLMIDVDHFKQLNDTYGHQFGDKCLEHAADILTKHARRPYDIVARYGGEEFVIMLPGASMDDASRIAETLRQAFLYHTMLHEGQRVTMTVSIGVSTGIPIAGDRWEALLSQADMHLYLAKENGRNRVEFAA